MSVELSNEALEIICGAVVHEREHLNADDVLLVADLIRAGYVTVEDNYGPVVKPTAAALDVCVERGLAVIEDGKPCFVRRSDGVALCVAYRVALMDRA